MAQPLNRALLHNLGFVHDLLRQPAFVACTCVIAHDCWQTILKQELWTAFYLNGEGWAIGDGMWTMSAVVWTDGDDSDDEIPYDTSSGDE